MIVYQSVFNCKNIAISRSNEINRDRNFCTITRHWFIFLAMPSYAARVSWQTPPPIIKWLRRTSLFSAMWKFLATFLQLYWLCSPYRCFDSHLVKNLLDAPFQNKIVQHLFLHTKMITLLRLSSFCSWATRILDLVTCVNVPGDFEFNSGLQTNAITFS